ISRSLRAVWLREARGRTSRRGGGGGPANAGEAAGRKRARRAPRGARRASKSRTSLGRSGQRAERLLGARVARVDLERPLVSLAGGLPVAVAAPRLVSLAEPVERVGALGREERALL